MCIPVYQLKPRFIGVKLNFFFSIYYLNFMWKIVVLPFQTTRHRSKLKSEKNKIIEMLRKAQLTHPLSDFV